MAGSVFIKCKLWTHVVLAFYDAYHKSVDSYMCRVSFQNSDGENRVA
jgi:hypothetical protein